MVKVAIITRSQNSSPRVLAECLNMMLPMANASTKLFHNINAFKRLFHYPAVKHKYSYPAWIFYKAIFYLTDKFFLSKLKSFDAIIISDSTPHGFLSDTYDIEKLRTIIGRIPILFYEVYFLGNAPTQIKMLEKENLHSIERYDWHLSITNVTEIRSLPKKPWSQIGLFLKGTGLVPNAKEHLFAIVDFAQPGNEIIRQEQIKVLKELSIPFVSFDRRYSINEIRKFYNKATFYFMQSSESFGLPIAECLSTGCYIFTPDSSWPMSWRLDPNPRIHGPGILPDCFVVYDTNLKDKLKQRIEDYNLLETPKKVFDSFYSNYPTYYDGNILEMTNVIEKIEKGKL